jgi:NAD+ synthase/NAD+ synthase (glutamine-hydrolysing)
MRLGLAQINPTVGDVDGNARLIRERIRQARDAGCDLVVLPELCLCGYPPKDLLLQEGFVEACEAVAREIGRTATDGIAAVFGLPRRFDSSSGRIANALVAYHAGTLLATYDKRLLPTYDVFDEDRYFTPGNSPAVIDSGGLKAGLSICEDLWKGEDAGFAQHYLNAADPVPALIAAGAGLIINPSASPFVLGKGRKHREILAGHARRHRCFVAAVNQVGGNDDLIFDGHAAAHDPQGRLIAAAPGFREHLLVVDLPNAQPVPHDPLLGAPEEELVFNALVLGTRDYCRKTGFKKAVLGISGGIDSAVTAAIGAAALGPENVTGLVMPGAYSSEHSKSDAYDLAQRLGITHHTVGIDPPLDGFRVAVDPMFASMSLPRLGERLPDLTEENTQSRVRGTLLMTFSNRTGAIVLTTGNKSELAVGYCTLYGDMNGGLAVLSDVSKQLVYRVARWLNANPAAAGFQGPPIPERSITKPPSAELRPNQTDQDSLPPYDVLDRIIERYIEGRQSPDRIVRETGIDAATVSRMVRLIHLAEYKRKQAAVGLKVTTVAFGSGRRWPIAQGWRDAR